MGWKIVNNNQPLRKECSYSGECPRFHMDATVSADYYKSGWAKTDTIPTYARRGCTCTLLEGSGEVIHCPWLEHCPFIPPEYL